MSSDELYYYASLSEQDLEIIVEQSNFFYNEL